MYNIWIYGWWFQPSEKKSVGVTIPNWMESHKNMFQTTNQVLLISQYVLIIVTWLFI